MNVKVNLTVGVDAKGNQRVLYIGPDGQKAKDVYEAAVNGSEPEIETVYLFIRPRHDRRHTVVNPAAEAKKAEAEAKRQAAEAKRQAAEAKKAAEAEAKRQAKKPEGKAPKGEK